MNVFFRLNGRISLTPRPRMTGDPAHTSKSTIITLPLTLIWTLLPQHPSECQLTQRDPIIIHSHLILLRQLIVIKMHRSCFLQSALLLLRA